VTMPLNNVAATLPDFEPRSRDRLTWLVRPHPDRERP
jgi:hypothetical protein